MALVYVSLGSNLGEREKFLAQARAAIANDFRLPRYSKIYETEPVGFAAQPWFLNQVAEFQTEMTPESLLEWVRALEAKAGRKREISKGPRTLDLDILLYDDRVQKEEELVLPHPRLEQRRHVLVPLAELAGERRLPVSRRTVFQALEQVTDPAQVKPHAST